MIHLARWFPSETAQEETMGRSAASAEAGWHETEEGYRRSRYRIERSKDPDTLPWVLSVDDTVPPLLGLVGRERVSRHRTRSLAIAAARRMERERIRAVKLERAALVIVVGIAGLAAVAPVRPTPASVVAACGLLFLVLRSAADAVDLHLGHAWGWPRDEGELARATFLDRVPARMVERLRMPVARATPEREGSRIVVG
jgi:hypothetical protein